MTKSDVSTRWFRRIFSFTVLLAVTLAAGTVFLTTVEGGAKLFEEGDTWWQIAVGDGILSTHTWPKADPYSFTAGGSPWIAGEWGGEVVMATVQRWRGLQGLEVLLVLLSATLVVLTYYDALVRCESPFAAAVAVALLLPALLVGFTLRPQLLGYIFFATTVLTLDIVEKGRTNALWIFPPLFLAWVNTHGSFILGLMVLGFYWASGSVDFRLGMLVAKKRTKLQQRSLLLVIFGSLLALFMTPYGLRLATYPFEIGVLQPVNLSYIPEWQPIHFAATWGQAFLILLLIWLVGQALLPTTHRLEIMVPLMVAAYETFLHRRFLVIFVLLFVPVLAEFIARFVHNYDASKERYIMNAVLIAGLLGFIFMLIPSRARLESTLQNSFPVSAVAYLREKPIPVGMFNEDHWGGFLIWSLAPQQKVFIDGRIDFYEYAGVLQDYVRIISLEEDPRPLLSKYGIRACLIQRNAPLETFLEASGDWTREYEDRIAILLVKANKSLDSPIAH